MKRAGFIRGQWVLLLAGVLAAVIVSTYGLHQVHLSERVVRDMKQIYTALEIYELNRGSLPTLALYPDRPREDADSIRVALDQYGARGEVYESPLTPAVIRDNGLSYVWNVALNGRVLADFEDPVWVLTEIHALSDQVDPPHFGQYHVLYSDGSVVRQRKPPEALGAL